MRLCFLAGNDRRWHTGSAFWSLLPYLSPVASKLNRKLAPPFAPMSPAEIQAATETIAQAHEFGYTRHISLQSIASVPADSCEEQVYRKLESLGLIQIEDEGETWVHHRAPNHRFNVTLTDAGTNFGTLDERPPRGVEDTNRAAARHTRLSDRRTSRAGERLIVFAVEYKWQPNEFGAHLADILPKQWKIPEETFPAKALLLRPNNVWKVMYVELGLPARPASASPLKSAICHPPG